MSDLVSYTVIADAVTVSTGRTNPQNKRPEVVRVAKGTMIEAPADSPQILTLLSARCIRPTADVTGTERVTPRSIMRAFKSAVTGKTNTTVAPIDAPLPVTDPNDL